MQKVYMWIGTFAVIMMIYLFLAPKLVKKPSGTPPRAGSNKEKAVIQQAAASGSETGYGMPYMLPYGEGQGLGVTPEGARGPAQPGSSFGGSEPGGFKLGQAYRARRRARSARRAFRGIKAKGRSASLFPFANLAVS